jgi:Ribonuclease G/E
MIEFAENFLKEHQLKSWLPQIVDALHDRNGRAHVDDIAKSAMLSLRRRQIGAVRETITRTINDHCSDAGDVAKDPPVAGGLKIVAKGARQDGETTCA